MNTTASDSNKDLLELYDYTNEADNSELPGSEISSPEKKPKATRMCMVKKAIEVVVLGTVIVTVWILLSLPIVFFHIRSDESLSNETDLQCSSNEKAISIGSGLDNVTCSATFYLNTVTGSCRPRCGQWEGYPHAKQVISDAIIGTAACIGIAVTLFIIVLACVRDRNMFKFPSVMVIYQDVIVSVFSLQALIGFMDRDLFCSSNDLLQTFQHSTPFCKLTGIVVIYTTLPLAVWAVAHVVITLWAIHFPFHYNQFKKTRKMTAIHVSSLLVGVTVPLLPAIITLTTRGFSVLDTRYPPIACRARDRRVTVYALIVPLYILLAIGVTALVFILRSLIKHFGPSKLKGPQIRIILVFVYYLLLGLLAVSAFTVSSNKLPKFTTEICGYFQCERAGNGHCNRDGFEQYTNATVVTIAYSLIELYPVVTLVFAVPSRDLKKLKRIFTCC